MAQRDGYLGRVAKIIGWVVLVLVAIGILIFFLGLFLMLVFPTAFHTST